jgi:hypothetical protein
MMSTAAVVRVAVRCLCLCPWEGRANAPFAYFYVDTSPSGHSPVSARPPPPSTLDTSSSSSTTTTTITTPECVCLYLTPCRPCHACPAPPPTRSARLGRASCVPRRVPHACSMPRPFWTVSTREPVLCARRAHRRLPCHRRQGCRPRCLDYAHMHSLALPVSSQPHSHPRPVPCHP